MKSKQKQAQKHEKLPSNEGMKRLTVDLSESLHRKLKFKSFEEDIPMTDLVRQMLEKSLR